MYTGPLRLLRALTLSATCVALSSATHLIGVGIGVNDSALDTYFSVASSRVGSAIGVLSPWRLSGLIQGMDAVAVPRAAVRAAGSGERFARWQRPRILHLAVAFLRTTERRSCIRSLALTRPLSGR